MAVVFPTKGDKVALVSFMSSLGLSGEDRPGEESTFGFSKETIRSAESCCEAILEHLHATASFFTGGGPLTGRNVLLNRTALTSGSVFPHARKEATGSVPAAVLSDVSAADVFGIANPNDFFTPQREELEIVKTQLESAKDVLQLTNRTHAYVWTTNVEVVRKFLGPQMEQSLSLIYSMDAARPKMRPADAESGVQGRILDEGGEAGRLFAEQDALRRLLALSADRLPSAAVKEAYARFIQTTDLLLRWLGTVLQMVTGEDDVPKSGTYQVSVKPSTGQAQSASEGVAAVPGSTGTADRQRALPDTVVEAARTRTVRVRRYEIHDAHYVYDNFIDQTRYFFIPEYTRYDARVQRRLLHPAYYGALRDVLAALTEEISRLSDIAARKTVGPLYTPSGLSPYDAFVPRAPRATATAAPGEDLPVVVFRPPLSSFRFLRDSLAIYLSSCINEDDTSSLLYYEHVYDDCLTQAREAAQVIRRLPTPPRAKGTSAAATAGHPTPSGGQPSAQVPLPVSHSDGAARSPRDTSFGMLQVDHAGSRDHLAAQDRRLSGWPPTQEEQGVLFSGFESYWEVRGKLHDLRTSLAKDIRQKDRTHMTRVSTSAVKNDKSIVELRAEAQQRQFLEHGRQTSSRSLWGTFRSSLEAIGNVVTCKAELAPGSGLTAGGDLAAGRADEEGIPLTAASPFHREKQLLLDQVNRLWLVMETQGRQLEVTYPGMFFRGEKEKWADRISRLAKKAEGASVVFSA